MPKEIEMLTRRLSRPLAIGAAVVVIGGGAVGTVAATSSNGSAGATTGQTAAAGFAAKAGSNARSGPAAGGVVGTVGSVSASSFTVSTSAGQKVTVKRASSTTYRNGTRSTSARAITKGKPVLVLGTTNGTTITATQVVVHPASGGSTTFTPSKVIPFKRGAQSTSKQDGQIPANYSQGSGTIVSGTTANKATKAALAAYPGGVVDRVVKLSNGEYEVHNIGVNWPHHIFVNKSFKVVGAN
jgi:preprotein translocase subunit YajC